MPVDRSKELKLAIDAHNAAKAARKKADDMGTLYMGSDEAKASHTKRQNMAEEDSEIMLERAKQRYKNADVMANPNSISANKKGGVIEGKKAGGSVKGWGAARGARKAKVY